MGKKGVTNEKRCQIIGLLKDKTKNKKEIAKLLGVSEKCVRTTRKNNDIYGRPRKLTNRDQNTLKKPLLTASDRIKRLKWCKKRLNWTIERWGMDTKGFSKKIKKKEKYDTRFVIPTLQGGDGSVGKWGCIISKGTGCCLIYEGRTNQHAYKETLENELLVSVDIFYQRDDPWFFQKDGTPAHRAKLIKEWFDENNTALLPWCVFYLNRSLKFLISREIDLFYKYLCKFSNNFFCVMYDDQFD
ncbi:transposable element Tc1 transposase [Brachionus plicatilis]|uniref:Transposable element Tc1 transposase n=1 Tax=Brachionus plicatilis TaxID=10195 RepID=A0A3M7RC22_BRAPC|nr:transposable element Tc1 transposase [Brachionus plicatilis]